MKRAIALFLALVFVFTLIPVSALADGTFPTVTFSVTYKEEDSAGNQTALTGSASFPREYDSITGLLAGASTEKLTLPTKNKIIEDIRVETTTVHAGFSGTFSIDKTGELKFTGGGITVADYPKSVALVVIIEYRDPTITFVNNAAGATYPGKLSGVASGESIPAGSVVTVTVNPPAAGGTFVGLSGVDPVTDVVNNPTGGVYSAKFTMPNKDVTVGAKYAFPVTLKTEARGVTLDTEQVIAGETVELAATEPLDEVFTLNSSTGLPETTGTTGGTVGTIVKHTDGSFTVPFTLTGAAAGETTIKSTKLYKLNLEGCEFVESKYTAGKVFKLSGTNAVYVEDATSVTLRSDEEANSYKWLCNDVPDVIPAGTGREYTFTMAASMDNYTFSATAVNQYKVTRKGVDGAADVVTYHVPEETVTETAPAKNAAGYNFAYWRIQATSLEVAAGDLTQNPISFEMPSSDATFTPIYLTTLKLTDSRIKSWVLPATGAPAPSKYKTETVNGSEVNYYWVVPDTQVTLEKIQPSGKDGTFALAGWRPNTSQFSNTGAVENPVLTMPADNVEVSTVWRSYTLTVRRFVDNSVVETYTLRPGEYITLDAQVPTGGTKFNYWTHSGGMRMTVNDVEVEMDEPKTERITIKMGNASAWVTANYLPINPTGWEYTGAHIEMVNEPTRYYAQLEYFNKSSLVVKYYPGQGPGDLNGTIVDNSQLTCRVIDPVTKETAMAADGCLTKTGNFALEITFRVNGVLMAQPIEVMNTPNTYIRVYTNRPEFVTSYAPHNKLNQPVYYTDESTDDINKDGLVVNLVSADHVTEGRKYYTARELAANEYELIAFNPLEAQYTTANKARGEKEIPTQADIDKAIAAGVAGYRKDASGKYYMQLGIKCFDENQPDSTGKPKRMEYFTDADNAIWIEVRGNAVNITDLNTFVHGGTVIQAFDTLDTTTGDKVVKHDKSWPSYSWEYNYSDIAAKRTFNIELDVDDGMDGVVITNEDATVAYVGTPVQSSTNKKVYTIQVVPRTAGVTKFTFYVRGNKTLADDTIKDGVADPGVATKVATLEITIKDNVGEIVKMTELLKLNKDTITLYVGNKITLYPLTFSPNNADTTMMWDVGFDDDLEPKNAASYVKVDPVTGVVEALKYTERPIRVYARAVNFVHPAVAAGATDPYPTKIPPDKVADITAATKDVASCRVIIASIPVYSMTMYPAELTMYRYASTKLTTRLSPEAATDQKINWTSSNSNIVSVDNEGRITAHMLGTATITATANSNGTVFKTCAVTVKESVLLTEILLSRNSAMLGIGESTSLSVYFSPATATTKSVVWESSDASVATVTATGKIHGMSEGTAIITATANDGSGKKAACVVSVSNIVTSAVVLNKQTLALIEDESETLAATIYPTNTSDAKVLWSSSNTKVAVVDQDGEVTGTGGGSAVITATARDASAKYADCVVVVAAKIPVTAIALNLGDFDMLLNDTTILTPTVSPANATYKATWTSSDNSVATVDEKGKVSALKLGSAIITCKAGDMTKAITVNVVTKTFSTGKVVNCTRRVNVRATASGTGTILGYAYLGDVYKVLDKTGNWFKIQYNASTTAYIWSRYLSATETSAGYTSAGKVGSTTTTSGTTTPAPTVTAKTLTITNCSYCVNVRSGAGTNFTKLGYAYKDEVFTYTGTSGDWYIITYNGATAYVSSQFVQVNG